MGKRYEASWSAVNEAVTRPLPVNLTPPEIGEHVTEATAPIPVTAWVRWHEASTREEARVVAWTAKAVKIEFDTRDGRQLTAWVWASAVDRT